MGGRFAGHLGPSNTANTGGRHREQPRATNKVHMPSCNKNIIRSQGSIRCTKIPTHWTHRKCSGINIRQYRETWKCNIHKAPSNSTQIKTNAALNINQSSNALQSQTPHTGIPDNSITNNNSQITRQQINKQHKKPINIDSIRKQKSKLEDVLDQDRIDIATIQETKFKKAHKTPQFNNYTTLRQDRSHKAGGGLITQVKNSITYTLEHIPASINIQKKGLQITKIHLDKSKHIYITSIYIPPRDTTRQNHPTEDQDITLSLI